MQAVLLCCIFCTIHRKTSNWNRHHSMWKVFVCLFSWLLGWLLSLLMLSKMFAICILWINMFGNTSFCHEASVVLPFFLTSRTVDITECDSSFKLVETGNFCLLLLWVVKLFLNFHLYMPLQINDERIKDVHILCSMLSLIKGIRSYKNVSYIIYRTLYVERIMHLRNLKNFLMIN